MSKIVEASKIEEPINVVGYHGTTRGGFDALKPNIRRGEQLGFGIHLASDYEFAGLYAFDKMVARKGGKSPRVIVALVSMTRPLHAARLVKEGTAEFELAKKLAGPRLVAIKDEDGVRGCWLQNAIDAASPERAQKLIEEAGYDGVVYRARVGTQGVNARYTAESLSYLVFKPEQVVIIEQRTEPKPRNFLKLVCPTEITWDEGDTDNTLCATFGRGDSHVRYTMDDAGVIRLLGIWRDRHCDDGIRGADMVRWLKEAYGRKILVDEVAPTAVGFWEKMLTEKVIAGYTDEPFCGETQPTPEPAPIFGGRRVLLDGTGCPQRFYRGSTGVGDGNSTLAFSASPVVASVQAARLESGGTDYVDGSVVEVVHLGMSNPLKLSTAGINLGALAAKLSMGSPGGVAREAMLATIAALVARQESGSGAVLEMRSKALEEVRDAVDRCKLALGEKEFEKFDRALSTVNVPAAALANSPVFAAALGEMGYDGIIHRQSFTRGSKLAVVIAGHQVEPEHINEKREVWMFCPFSPSQVVSASEFRIRPEQSGLALKDATSPGRHAARAWAPA